MIRSLLLSLLLCAAPVAAYGQFAVRATHAGAGHGPMTNGTFSLQGSAGQAVAGTIGSGPRLRSGFWPALTRPAAVEAVFAVTIDGTNAPVTEGDDLTVTATIENTGAAAGTQTIRLTVGGAERASQTVSLDAGQSDTATLSWATAAGDAGDYTATVASDDDSDSRSVSVLALGATCTLAWSLDIFGTDDDVGFQTLTLGQSADATAALDPACEESELPPKPVGGFTDLRFVGSTLPGVNLGLGSRTDIRPRDTRSGTTVGDASDPGDVAPAVWKIDITSEHYPVTLTWDNTTLATDIPNQPVFLIDVATGGDVVSVDMKQVSFVDISNPGVEAVKILLDQEVTRTLTFHQGWNLKSIPVEASDMTFGALLGSACQSGFIYEPGSGYVALDASDELTPGQGGFFNCTAGTVDVTGRPPSTTEVDVVRGWNIVGPLAADVSAGTARSTPVGILQSVFFGLDRSSGYVPASALQLTEGYWVKTSADGTIDLSGTGKALSNAALAKSAHGSLPEAIRLTLTDAQNRSAVLRLLRGASENAVDQFALPPRPPSGIFDVRFSGAGRVAVLPDGEAEAVPVQIDLQDVAFPIQLRLDGPVQDQTLRIEGDGGLDVQLTADHPSTEIAKPLSALHVGLEGLPLAITLHKNYPNPVTDQATISYDLPVATEVRIDVYDVLGRRVARLVDGPQPAGSHSVAVDATRMPTGMYFYRLQAGNVVQTQRMAVLR